MTELTFSPEQQAAIEAARKRRQASAGGFSPEQQAAIEAARARRSGGQAVDAMAEFEKYNPGKIAQYGYKTPEDLPKRGEPFPAVGTARGLGPGGIVQGPGMSSNQGLVYGIGNAMSLGMGQEISAGIEAALTDKTYGEALAQNEAVQADAQASGGYGAGNVVGSFTPVGIGGKFIQAAKSIPGLMTRSGAVGAGYGAVAGAGEPGDFGERARNALSGAAMGAVAGGLLPGVVAGGARLLGGRAAPQAAEAAGMMQPATTQPAVSRAAEDARLGDLMKRAARGSEKAKLKLAEEIRLNPEVKAAADRLGIELPADVMGDNIAAAEIAGLSRAQIGTEPSAQWWATVKDVRDKADDIVAKIGGGTDLSSLSDDVKTTLTASRGALKTTEDGLYSQLREIVPAPFAAKLDNIKSTVAEIYRDVGGKAMMRAEENKIFDIVSRQGMTFGGLTRLKQNIGDALYGGAKNIFGDVNRADLTRLYGALKDDLMATIEAHGSPAAVELAKKANALTVERKGIEDQIEAAFGADGAGSLAAKLRTALTSGAKGDASGLTKILGAIPADMRKRALATGIGAVTRSARSSEPGFGLTEFAKFMGGLSNNKAIKAQFARELGPEAMGLLDDLHTIAKRVNIANGRIPKTGASLQGSPAYKAFSAPGVVEGLVNTTVGKKIVQGGLAGAGYATGGPVGAAAGVGLSNALTRVKDVPVKALSDVLQSAEFKNLATKAALGRVDDAAIAAAAKSAPMRGWAKVTGVGDPKAWLEQFLETAKTVQPVTDAIRRAGTMAEVTGTSQQ